MPIVNQIIKPGDIVRFNDKYIVGAAIRFKEFEVLETNIDVWGKDCVKLKGYGVVAADGVEKVRK